MPQAQSRSSLQPVQRPVVVQAIPLQPTDAIRSRSLCTACGGAHGTAVDLASRLWLPSWTAFTGAALGWSCCLWKVGTGGLGDRPATCQDLCWSSPLLQAGPHGIEAVLEELLSAGSPQDHTGSVWERSL